MGGLIFREWFMVKKKIIGSMIFFLAFSVLSILVLLSFDHGNLRLLPDEMREPIRTSVFPMLQLMPAFCAGALIISAAEGSVRDELVSWQRFRRSTPVEAWKYAAARYIIYTGLLLFSAGVTMLYLLICSAVSDTSLTADIAAPAFLMLAFSVVFGVIFQIYIMLFHTMDKAGIALLATVIVLAVPLVMSTDGTKDNIQAISAILDLSKKIFPFTPIIFIGALGIGFAVSTMLLRRREK